MRGPAAAGLSAAMFAILALFFAPLMVVTAAIIGLCELRHGIRLTAQVLAIATIVCAGVYYAVLGRFEPVILPILGWIPTVVAAAVLKRTGSQGAAFSIIGVLVGVYTLVMRMTNPDVKQFWLGMLGQLGETVVAEGGGFFEPEEVQVIANVMHEASIVILTLFFTGSLLIARWWQAALYNPGGFRSEFLAFALPRAVSPVAALIAVGVLLQLAAAEPRGLASDLVVVLVVLFAFQGLALLYFRMDKVGMSAGWLVGLYLLLILMPHVAGTVLAAIGIADAAIDFRGLRNAKA
jgi:hypothetical protein